MARLRRSFSAEQKAEIVRRHLVGKEPVSKLAEEFRLQPTQIHAWVNQVLTQAPRAFERSSGPSHEAAKDNRIRQLEAKLAQKNEVIDELLEANVREKKRNGAL